MPTTEIPLSGVVAEHFRAVNAFDVDAIVSTFAPDAYVNDNRREIRGAAAIRRWVEKEMVAEHVSVEPVEVLDHYGDVIVRGRYDGDFDRSGLPDELIMSNYFSLRDGRIVSLAVVLNQPSEYGDGADAA
ncbi:nuclear transport factor 2 family protein [Streptomyces sp. NPDC088923]|uniref:nuclear transport factor 2 family protein n=1 Tax=Streptomyces sp. NPDC088923 TaxID=3365913 RepID=UPI00380922D5